MVGNKPDAKADEYTFVDSSAGEELDSISKKLHDATKKDIIVKCLKV